MRDPRLWPLALGVATIGITFSADSVAAQSRRTEGLGSARQRLAEAESILRQLTTESGVGVTLGNSGSVEVTVPESTSPFAKKRALGESAVPRVDAGASDVRVFVDRQAEITPQRERPQLPAEVQGLLQQFAPQVRVTPGAVQLDDQGIRVDTRNGVNVDLHTSSGRVRISQRAIEDYSAARSLFYKGDYRQAILLMNSAVEEMPREQRFRQFRALVYFALGEYASAADDAYQALTPGTIWDWATVHALYTDPAEYAAQYRSLQRACREHEQSVELHFLLAYHHTLLGHHPAALKSWRQAERFLPEDPVVMAQIRQLEARPRLGE
jgi:hypothetical protein